MVRDAAHPNALPDAEPGNAYTTARRLGDADPDSNAYAYTTIRNTDADSVRNADADPVRNADADPDPNGDSNTCPDTDADTLVCL